MSKNKINQTGGKITANIISVGDNSNINADNLNLVTTKNDIAEISKLIEELIANVNSLGDGISNKLDIISSIDSLKAELNKEKPSKTTLSGIGKTILENLKYVKDVAPIVHAIWKRIETLID